MSSPLSSQDCAFSPLHCDEDLEQFSKRIDFVWSLQERVDAQQRVIEEQQRKMQSLNSQHNDLLTLMRGLMHDPAVLSAFDCAHAGAEETGDGCLTAPERCTTPNYCSLSPSLSPNGKSDDRYRAPVINLQGVDVRTLDAESGGIELTLYDGDRKENGTAPPFFVHKRKRVSSQNQLSRVKRSHVARTLLLESID